MAIHRLALSFLIVFNLSPALSAPPATAGGLSHSIEKRPLVRSGQRETDYLRLLAEYAIYAHWNIISPVYGDRCRMKPSCSLYSYEAYRRYGFLRGSILTFDRLMHEGNEYKVSPVVYDRAGKRYLTHDPLENNVFWWGE